MILHNDVSCPEGSRPRFSRFSRAAGGTGLALAPKAAGGGGGDPVAARDGRFFGLSTG